MGFGEAVGMVIISVIIAGIVVFGIYGFVAIVDPDGVTTTISEDTFVVAKIKPLKDGLMRYTSKTKEHLIMPKGWYTFGDTVNLKPAKFLKEK